MGFRCPTCRIDFGRDHAPFKDHLNICESGRDIASLILKITGDKENQKQLGILEHKISIPSRTSK